ncbi:MAG: hypothetical protein JSV12_08285 [Candidatus Bathyarchaeota archaeon]|nr:MAG: hypothetical protein JSV12_08285 [Candidatus Bathyarchaeota archaeon]
MNRSVRARRVPREFVVVTLITLISIVLIIAVYATILGTYTGGNVTVVTLSGTIYYSQDNSTGWATTLSNIANGSAWYTRFNVTTGGYSGAVSITWWLQKAGANMTPAVEQTTSYTLGGGTEAFYASSNGAQSGNYNWGQNATAADTYRVMMTVLTA